MKKGKEIFATRGTIFISKIKIKSILQIAFNKTFNHSSREDNSWIIKNIRNNFPF